MQEYNLITKEHVERVRTNKELFCAYADYLMRLGYNKEKAEFITTLNLPIVLHDRRIYYSTGRIQTSKIDSKRTINELG